jgi:hypothetical protein
VRLQQQKKLVFNNSSETFTDIAATNACKCYASLEDIYRNQCVSVNIAHPIMCSHPMAC